MRVCLTLDGFPGDLVHPCFDLGLEFGVVLGLDVGLHLGGEAVAFLSVRHARCGKCSVENTEMDAN